MPIASRQRIAPNDSHLECAADGWAKPLAVSDVALCQLYNCLEARTEWSRVIVEWERAAYAEGGWSIPCRVDIPFVKTVISFLLRGFYRPEISAVDISIPEDSIVEHDASFARLMRIDLLPGFGGAAYGEAGYLLLPCLAGVLHRFDHAVSRSERIAIYARQDQWAMRSNFNCIGMQRNDLAWCAIVTEGDCDAEAVVQSHYDEEAKFSVHIGLVYRWEHGDARTPGNRTVRYYLLNPAQSGWAAFARCYRRFLRDERGMRTWREKYPSHPKMSAFARGFLMKIFQGCKRPDLHGRGEYQSATSFAEAQEILELMQAEGIERITVELVGWNHEGHDGRYPTRFPINPVEGGEEGLRALIGWGERHGVIVSVHDNALDSYEIADDFSHADGIVLRDGSHWRNVPWCGGFNWRMCPTQSIRHVQRDYPRMKELGVDGHYYIDALAAFNTCHSAEHPANRSQYIDAVREILKFTKNLFGALSLEVPFGPYFDLMDGVYIDEAAEGMCAFTDFGRNFVDEVVPFLPVALHNSVRYHRGSDASAGKAGALRSLAWGAMPFIEVAARKISESHPMPTYGNFAEYAREGYRLCCVEYADLVGVDLDDVTGIAPDLFVTSYSNGANLLINASATPATIDGKLVPRQSVVRAEA
ncbi:MAG: DUF5696 domain-containing protein [Capsulimonadaceae bacterium]|nr:DUF5696 domain-containing protein [Capsulimonadaceae bacterium]